MTETAQAGGLPCVPEGKRDPMTATGPGAGVIQAAAPGPIPPEKAPRFFEQPAERLFRAIRIDIKLKEY